MKADRIDLGLTGYDELFMSTEERLDTKKPKVDELPLDELKPFKDHPFKVIGDEEMERLKDSIRESGVLIPALARPAENGYELISGHRRLAACRALGLSTMPVIVRNLTDEEAVIAMVDSNLQREHILPSEKAFAYKMKMEALSHQGKTSRQVGEKWSVSQISEAGNDSERQIHRYIRLTNLIPDILKLVDEGRIALTPAVELSYLNSHEQNALYQIMDCDEVTPSLSQAQRLRKLSEDYTLTDSGISQIMSEIKGNQKEYLKIEAAPLKRYFPPGTTAKQMQTTMIRAMEFYRQHTQNRADKPKEREER
jgi:ParB family chromosome partitioning protein